MSNLLKYWVPVYTRQGISLLLVVVLFLGSFVGLLIWSNERYHQEVTQQLHQGLAQYVAEHTNRPIFDEQGEVDHGILKAIAMNTMMINPSVEVYLLDTQGKILGHALPDLNGVELMDIDIAPIKEYLNAQVPGPVFGTNPRSPDIMGIFSVAPLSAGDTMKGYLYVMLASELRNSLAERLADSYILKVTLAGMVILLLILLAFMVLGFRHFSKPIRSLAAQMRDYRRLQNDEELAPYALNEVEELRASFDFMQTRIQEQFDQLAKNDAMRRELVSNISHDLRTPLAAMQGYIETIMLKKNSLSEAEIENFLAIAHRHSQKLATLISQLFELSKLDTGAMSAKFERFSITELVADICAEHQILADKQKLKLILDVPEDSLYVRADIALIGRVIQNLLDNAMQHTDEGGAITLALEPSGDTVSVVVTDSGRGISKESLPFVFERNYQAAQPEARKTVGAGLGLSIVKKILDLHKTTINIQSEVAVGTQIRFQLAV